METKKAIDHDEAKQLAELKKRCAKLEKKNAKLLKDARHWRRLAEEREMQLKHLKQFVSEPN